LNKIYPKPNELKVISDGPNIRLIPTDEFIYRCLDKYYGKEAWQCRITEQSAEITIMSEDFSWIRREHRTLPEAALTYGIGKELNTNFHITGSKPYINHLYVYKISYKEGKIANWVIKSGDDVVPIAIGSHLKIEKPPETEQKPMKTDEEPGKTEQNTDKTITKSQASYLIKYAFSLYKDEGKQVLQDIMDHLKYPKQLIDIKLSDYDRTVKGVKQWQTRIKNPEGASNE
jgi:hypothetical protein